ncbi:hypothetical protein BTR23_14645 [Alkalihalophilus pseudofirmus]|uniref:hypothetical protein n=1 Tax=Alkalihalobacterium alkalinitrilicum TaxID=427920 RepID=UPI00094D2938|nr:hypothetical protein [Alkalihalobacterium alkalinitrilicum]OLO36980.1 hypothetical protein BTR23_14645 [Alkalihalophilus pseudofirmus]
MKRRISFALPFLLIFILLFSIELVHADEGKRLGGNSVTFKGASQDWYVEHEMNLNGTEIEYSTKITYKGKHKEMLNSSPLYYEIISNKGGSYGGCFNLKRAHEFQSQTISCGGCHYLGQETEVKCVIRYANFQKDEILTLKKETF